MSKNISIKPPAVASIIMLLLAIFPLPYGYYALLRLVVCFTGIFLAWHSYRMQKIPWVWVMGLIALIFNPLMPIHLDKVTWSFIDFIVAAIFLVSISKLKEEKK